jgi:hypothetical protein
VGLLGLGIGAVVSSVMNSVLWRPLPYPDADRLVIVQARARRGRPLPLATQQSVLPAYLRVMGIPLREGRDFTIEDLEA